MSMDAQHEKPGLEAGWGGQGPQISRRSALKMLAATAATLSTLETLAWTPMRIAQAAPNRLPDIQFDINNFIAPAITLDNVLFRFGPVYTLFVTIKFAHTPTRHDQAILKEALDTIEDVFPFSPQGVFTFLAYGLPYFHRLPHRLVHDTMPRLNKDQQRFALEEAVPSPTDVSAQNPQVQKQRFNVPVVIEQNDLLLTLRSDRPENLLSVLHWLQGSDQLGTRRIASPRLRHLFQITSTRLMFVQRGLPRRLANQKRLSCADDINPQSPMWMGFADQQAAGSGPAEITTFQGNASARFTTTRAGDYFFNGSIQHLAHTILDLEQFYARDEPYTERVQYMFRSNPIPSVGNPDQYKNGGGPTFLPNEYKGTDDALKNAEGIDTFQGGRRVGHVSALQQSSRAQDGTPIHIRSDGPGFDAMDVPDGTPQPKLQFSVFVPSADFFAQMRRNQAALHLARKYGVKAEDNGLERFLTATRRQNFLVPPRVHRAFPLIELT